MGQTIISRDKQQALEVLKKLKDGGLKDTSIEGHFSRHPHYITVRSNGNFSWASESGRDILKSIDLAQKNRQEIITADKFLSNPTVINGWKKQPSIEIDVKINGKTAKLSDISEETLRKLREV